MPISLLATVIQTPSPGTIEVLPRSTITVGDDGVITDLSPAGDSQPAASSDLLSLPDHQVLLPGLIDTHIHAPQWPQLGTGLDLPLERWLMDYTFPLEARCQDLDYAAGVWDSMVPALLGLGTTTAVYYGSTHEPATLALAQACLKFGQRAFVGRVAMDHPEATPPWYRDRDAATAVAASHRSIEAIRALAITEGTAGAKRAALAGLAGSAGLVQPIITPRFIPACTDAALEGLGELAEATGCRIQTHCSESDWQHGYAFERYGQSDAASLHRFGLVRDHTVLAHATHLSDDDRRLLVAAGAGVAHCPLSNVYFANAVFPARRNLTAGLRVGLGTDIAGGPEASLLAQCGHAVTSSRMLEDGVDAWTDPSQRGLPDSRIDMATAFWMATLGGAELLGIPAGLLAPGRVFDAFSVDLRRLTGSSPTADDTEPNLERIVRGAGAGAIDRVWVNGRDVTPNARLR